MPAPRLRFAPSPTGYLHVGGARTALFNWLYARRHGGAFILRIEDTDQERSSRDMVERILSSLRWLGLDWDEGPDVGGPHAPYFQGERTALYRRAIARLVETGHAYHCYCTQEDLQARREAAEAAGVAWQYDRTCRTLSREEVAAREARRAPRVVRFAVPEGDTAFDDQVHGRIAVSNRTLDDFVLERSDGSSVYQLSVVVDDIDMAITHVVRGDDHISNTPKQILIYQALGAAVPIFAHVPLILGQDKKRLSKRHGATAVGEYETQGILPEAMVNFLALLGWSPGEGDQEVFSREELIARFALDGISGGGAVFNPEKLEWFNQQHIAWLDAATILERIEAPLTAAGVPVERLDAAERRRLERVIDLVKPRVRRLADFVTQVRPFVAEDNARDPQATAKYLPHELAPHLAAWRDEVARIAPFDAASLEAGLRSLAASRGLKPAALIHATRVAVTGQAVSPSLFDVLELMGRQRVLSRLSEVA